MAESIFQKIARGETDTEILFQDDRCFVIRDLNPVAPVHLLIIPFWKCTSLAYIGPGLALGTVLISLALILVLIFVIIAILYYPIKKALTKYKNKIK